MRQLSKSALIAVSTMALLSCETVGRQVADSTPLPSPPREAIYPATALKRCPETLPGLNVSEVDWAKLEAPQQLALLNRQGQSWVIEYFKCATRHNMGADVYEGQLRERVMPDPES